jgi:hypothetical protein
VHFVCCDERSVWPCTVGRRKRHITAEIKIDENEKDWACSMNRLNQKCAKNCIIKSKHTRFTIFA